MNPTGFVSFDQFVTALSEWLHPVIVANHIPEIADLYCAGESVQVTAEAIALIHQISAPNTCVI